MSSADTDPHAAALRWLVRRFGPPRGWPILGLASGLFQTAMTLALSALLAHVLYGLAIERQPLSELDSAWWSLPLCWVLRALAGVMREEAGARASLSVRSRLRVALLEALYRLGPAWVTKRQTGGLTAAVLEQVEAVDGYFSRIEPADDCAGSAAIQLGGSSHSAVDRATHSPLHGTGGLGCSTETD
jgi:ATP-binding cassette subfamily C protein CydD